MTAGALALGPLGCAIRSAGPGAAGAFSATRPNIVHIITDQLSTYGLGCYGSPHVKTPHIDALAATGLRFNQAYTAYPLCVANRASMLTGLVASQTRQVDDRRKTRTWTEAELKNQSVGWRMRDAGYDVFYSGKWHVVNMGDCNDHGYAGVSRYGGHGEMVNTECTEFLNQKHDKPFYMTASYIQPHGICFWGSKNSGSRTNPDKKPKDGVWPENLDPWDPELGGDGYPFPQPDPNMPIKDFVARHCPPLPANYLPPADEPESLATQRRKTGIICIGKGNIGKDLTEEEWWRLLRWTYLRLCEQVDTHVGVLLKALRDSGHTQDTLIIFTSDHGEGGGAHKLRHKSTNYDEPARVPLIVSQPGTIVPRVDDAHLVNNGTDFLPTLLDYAEGAVPARLHGTSWRPLIEGRKVQWRTHLYAECKRGAMIRSTRHKYTKYSVSPRNPEQLFDMKADPGEMRSLVASPPHATVLNEHRKLMDAAKTQIKT
jgi:arylsulfatase A-like enzyme